MQLHTCAPSEPTAGVAIGYLMATANRSQRRAMAARQVVRVRAALARVRRHDTHAVLGVELEGFHADAGWARRRWLRLRHTWLLAAGCSRFLPHSVQHFCGTGRTLSSTLSLYTTPLVRARGHPSTSTSTSTTTHAPTIPADRSIGRSDTRQMMAGRSKAAISRLKVAHTTTFHCQLYSVLRQKFSSIACLVRCATHARSAISTRRVCAACR